MRREAGNEQAGNWLTQHQVDPTHLWTQQKGGVTLTDAPANTPVTIWLNKDRIKTILPLGMSIW